MTSAAGALTAGADGGPAQWRRLPGARRGGCTDTRALEMETRSMDEHPNASILRGLNERLKDGDFQAGFDILADDVEWYEIGRDEPTRGREALGRRYEESVGDFEIKTDMHDVLANDEHAI